MEEKRLLKLLKALVPRLFNPKENKEQDLKY